MPQKVDTKVEDPFFDVAGCATYLGRTERWVRRNVNEGVLPFTRMGRYLAFRKSSLDEWAEANTVKPDGQ